MAYLNKIKPYRNISPIKHIKELMELRNWDRSKVAEKLGMSVAEINELFDDDLPIKGIEAAALTSVFGISYTFWLNLDKNYRVNRKK